MATSLMVMVRLVFGDENTPSAKFTSAASTLSACAAMALAFSTTLSVAIVKGGARHGGRARAAGAFAVEHLVGVALHVAHLVRVEPEPVADQLLEHGFVALAGGIEPENKVAVPPRSKRTSAPSVPAAAARSMVLEMPKPRSLPRLRDSSRRFLKPLMSASSSARSMFFSNSPQS